MTTIPPSSTDAPLPMARVIETTPRADRWILVATLVGLVAVAGLLVVANWQRNEVITISFRDGHGLRTGDPLRHRGIDVGRVISVELDPSLASVIVRCELYPGAEQLARTGSKFWVVRPSVTLSGIEGLDTIVGSRYLSVLPGPETGERTNHFVGLRDSPGSAEIVDGGLEITLEAPERFGLARGTPIYFRGMRVGEVTAVALSSDSLTVEARAMIGPDYRSLVRENSVFWKDSGVNVHLGIRGLNLDVGTLESLAAGGVAFATPDPPGEPVAQGHRFPIEPKEADDWRDWRPRLVVGKDVLRDQRGFPSMLRAEIFMTKRGLIRRRSVRIPVWLLPLAGKHLVGPASLFNTAESDDHEDNPARLAFDGEELVLKEQVFDQYGKLVDLRSAFTLPSDVRRWPFRVPVEPEDCLVVTDPEVVPLPLSRQRLSASDGTWLLDDSLALSDDLWGAAIVSRADGAVIGLLDFVEERPVVVPIPAELARLE